MPITLADGRRILSADERTAIWRRIRDEHQRVHNRDIDARIDRDSYLIAFNQYNREIRAAEDELNGVDVNYVNVRANPEGNQNWGRFAVPSPDVDLNVGRIQRQRPVPRPIKKSVEKTKKPVMAGETTVRQAFALAGEPPRQVREGMLLSLLPAEFPYDHCVGLEVEVENYRDVGVDPELTRLVLEAFEAKADGSLRNQGMEFVTKYGVTAGDAITYSEVLNKLFVSLQDKGHNKFTFRCGLHVHVDVLEHTLEQLYRVFLVYSVVESLLFEVSGKRDCLNSVKFCVPVMDAASAVASSLYYGHEKNWPAFVDSIFNGSKYMAMNIRTVRRYGTIEFRHHEGTSDHLRISKWLLILLDLVVGAKSTNTERLEKEIAELNTVSDYQRFLMEYFPNSYYWINTPEYEKLMYRGVAFIKETIITQPAELSKLLRELD